MLVGIISAMDDEINEVLTKMKTSDYAKDIPIGLLKGTRVAVTKCGIGKVNAAATAQKLIDLTNPDIVIFSGIAGALHDDLKVGDAVIATSLTQHDFDLTAFGYEPGQVPGATGLMASLGIVGILEEALHDLGIRYVLGKIASGDKFVIESDQKKEIASTFDAAACEMEGAAVAQVCAMNSIPFGVVRLISDGDSDTITDYNGNEMSYAHRSAMIPIEVAAVLSKRATMFRGE